MSKISEQAKIKHYEVVFHQKFDPELRTLYASGTRLKELPVMPELRTLYARGTQLKELPVMPHLEYLDASGTQLKELPVMPELRTLDARGTQLKGNYKETLLISPPIGSRSDITEYWVEADDVKCGCWNSNLLDFARRVKNTYKTGKHRRDYLAFIAICKKAKRKMEEV